MGEGTRCVEWYPRLRLDFERLVASYQAGHGHHTLLIQALPGIDDDTLIYVLGRYLMYQEPEGHKSCGQCRGCQLIWTRTHLDYRSLLPEEGKSMLGIDAVCEVSEKLYEHSRLGGAKAVWIPDAARLAGTTANTLLKTLGELSVQTWFSLASAEPAHLLATLRSRCQLHRLAPPPGSYMISWLVHEVIASSGALFSALRLSAGSLGTALTLLQTGSWVHHTDFYAVLMNTLNAGD